MTSRFHIPHVQFTSKSAHRALSRALSTITNHPISINNNTSHPHFDSSFFIDEFNDAIKPDRNVVAQLWRYTCPRDPYVINQLISSCARSSDLDGGSQLHRVVYKLGFVSNVYICSALVDMYGKCGRISCAHKVFDEMPQRNAVTWNSLIFGYVQGMCPEVAVGLFVEMMREGVSLTPFGISGILVACAQLEDAELGVQVQGLGVKCGFCCNAVVGTGLVNMYAKCMRVEESRRVFEGMPKRNVITWTVMVTGYAHNGLPLEAMILFRRMRQLGYETNYLTYNGLLCSFYGKENLKHCKQIHGQIVRHGLDSNPYIQATLLSVYSECDMEKEDFNSLCSIVTRWDQITYNAAIAGLSRLECGVEALQYFSNMRGEGIKADFFTLSSILRAIGIISALDVGKQTHALVFKFGCASNVHVQNGLVSMYARCGLINEANSVFTAMTKRDLVSWNSLLSGFASHGYGHQVIRLFEQMKSMGIQPNQTTILSVLSACSHVGLLEKGLEYVELFRGLDFHDSLTLEHCASIVDLFGRAGYLQEAEAFISSMPMEPGMSMYKSLISACKLHGNTEIAMRASQKLLELYPNDPGNYVLLSISLVTGGFWGEAAGVMKQMQDKGVQKKPGYSWTEPDKLVST